MILILSFLFSIIQCKIQKNTLDILAHTGSKLAATIQETFCLITLVRFPVPLVDFPNLALAAAIAVLSVSSPYLSRAAVSHVRRVTTQRMRLAAIVLNVLLDSFPWKDRHRANRPAPPAPVILSARVFLPRALPVNLVNTHPV